MIFNPLVKLSTSKVGCCDFLLTHLRWALLQLAKGPHMYGLLAMHLFVVQKVGVKLTEVVTLSTTLMLFWFEIEPRL